MALIETIGLSKDFAGTPILTDVKFVLEEGERLGLVGSNGAGKTTLLRILLGDDDDYSGTVVRTPGAKIGYAPQHPVFPSGFSCLDAGCEHALSLRASLQAMEQAMGHASGRDLDRLLADYSCLREAYEAEGGDEAEKRTLRKLEKAGLGGKADIPVEKLSGGERNVLALIRALHNDPELLILDEPGNHLDHWGLAWLESFLIGLRVSMLVVSHDRRLLDMVCTRIVEIERCVATSWTGNYSRYRLEKGRALSAQGADWQADRKKLERLEALVKRFEQIARATADPTWGKRLRARRSQLERGKENAVEQPKVGGRRLDVNFAATDSKASIALDIRGYRKAFGERVLFDGASFNVVVGERVALVGRNGCGKTTLLRDLVQTGSWDHDILRVGPSMRIGYCAQYQEVFSHTGTVQEEFEKLGAREAETRSMLGRFGFAPDELGKHIAALSGGELNRLQIARAVYLKANLLILDEPTNHLDIASREAVEEGLSDFDGTMLVVSHDRWFLERIVERILYIEDLTIKVYEGSFSEFWRDTQGVSLLERPVKTASMESRSRGVAESVGGKARAKDTVGANARDMEARILELERGKGELERRISRAVTERKFAEGSKLSAELEKTNTLIERLYKEWN